MYKTASLLLACALFLFHCSDRFDTSTSLGESLIDDADPGIAQFESNNKIIHTAVELQEVTNRLDTLYPRVSTLGTGNMVLGSYGDEETRGYAVFADTIYRLEARAKNLSNSTRENSLFLSLNESSYNRFSATTHEITVYTLSSPKEFGDPVDTTDFMPIGTITLAPTGTEKDDSLKMSDTLFLDTTLFTVFDTVFLDTSRYDTVMTEANVQYDTIRDTVTPAGAGNSLAIDNYELVERNGSDSTVATLLSFSFIDTLVDNTFAYGNAYRDTIRNASVYRQDDSLVLDSIYYDIRSSETVELNYRESPDTLFHPLLNYVQTVDTAVTFTLSNDSAFVVKMIADTLKTTTMDMYVSSHQTIFMVPPLYLGFARNKESDKVVRCTAPNLNVQYTPLKADGSDGTKTTTSFSPDYVDYTTFESETLLADSLSARSSNWADRYALIKLNLKPFWDSCTVGDSIFMQTLAATASITADSYISENDTLELMYGIFPDDLPAYGSTYRFRRMENFSSGDTVTLELHEHLQRLIGANRPETAWLHIFTNKNHLAQTVVWSIPSPLEIEGVVSQPRQKEN